MLSLRVVTEASYMVEDARLLEGQPQNWQCHFCILPVEEGNKDSSDSRGKGSRFIVIVKQPCLIRNGRNYRQPTLYVVNCFRGILN